MLETDGFALVELQIWFLPGAINDGLGGVTEGLCGWILVEFVGVVESPTVTSGFRFESGIIALGGPRTLGKGGWAVTAQVTGHVALGDLIRKVWFKGPDLAEGTISRPTARG